DRAHALLYASSSNGRLRPGSPPVDGGPPLRSMEWHLGCCAAVPTSEHLADRSVVVQTEGGSSSCESRGGRERHRRGTQHTIRCGVATPGEKSGTPNRSSHWTS